MNSPDWRVEAIAWLRATAAEQAQACERWPDHAKVYPSWRQRVDHAQRLADKLEAELTRERNDVA